MLTSPGWYVAICCAPTLFFEFCVAIAAFLPFGRAVAGATTVAPITKTLTIALFGYGLWHFGIFTGLGIIVISMLCARFADRCIGKLLNRVAGHRVAGYRQAIIHAMLDKARVVEMEAMAEMVEELECYDDKTLRDFADEVLDSERPADALFMGVIARRLDQMENQADDDDATPAEASDVRQRSDKRSRLLVDFEILDEDGRPTSSRAQAKFKTRRRRKAKSRAAAKDISLQPEKPGNHR